MSRELYQEVIIDHNKNPRNFGEIKAEYFAEGFNPICGDHYKVFINMNDDKIHEIKFSGTGCAISKSSASIMTTILKDKTKKEALKLFEKFHELVSSDKKVPELGKLAVFEGVRDYPSRVKCANLPWYTMRSAINKDQSVTTE